MSNNKKVFNLFVIISLLIAGVATTASANHSWGGYHWARTANPLVLKLGNNLSGQWSPVLLTASNDWSQSSVLDTMIVSGGAGKNCRPTLGRVEVCNSKYGNNGWLGIAQIWISADGHITQGTTKLNDTYFSRAPYNTIAWRNLVTCQEVGHTFGLAHQDEIFDNANLGTCMDYTSNPTSNQHPNAHDYEELEIIYAHLDSTNTSDTVSGGALGADIDTTDPHSWGKALGKDKNGNENHFERDLGDGSKLITEVYWVGKENNGNN